MTPDDMMFDDDAMPDTSEEVSTAPASSLRELLAMEKRRYLDEAREHGGTARGFRERIRERYKADTLKYTALTLEALLEATTRKWEQQPRKFGPDLFSVAGFTIPEYLTRQSADYLSEDASEESKYEKVVHTFATVNDLHEDALIKMRNAARAGARAEAEMRIVDAAKRRAGGRMTVFLRDITDDKTK